MMADIAGRRYLGCKAIRADLRQSFEKHSHEIELEQYN
jgi:hypothetical protein